MNIKSLLENTRRIHILGLSPQRDRTSNQVAHYLHDHGYDIVGIRPGEDKTVDGFPTYASLSEVPEEIEILDVFRASEHLPSIVEQAIAHGRVKVLWLQLGISHPEAEETAKNAGITVVKNQCTMREHKLYFSHAL